MFLHSHVNFIVLDKRWAFLKNGESISQYSVLKTLV